MDSSPAMAVGSVKQAPQGANSSEASLQPAATNIERDVLTSSGESTPTISRDVEQAHAISTDNESFKLKRDPCLVRFARDDPENPFNWSTLKKSWICFVYLLNTMWAVGLSAAYSPLAQPVEEEFHTSAIVSRLPLAVFLFGFAFGPLVLSPVGEDYGRRSTFTLCLALVYLLQIPCALAPNIGALIAARFLCGVLASPMLNACGAVPDLWPSTHPAAGWALNCWALSAELIVVAPWIGALVEESYGWRMLFWVALGVGAGLAALFAICVPETRHGVLLARKAARLRVTTGNESLYAAHEQAMSNRNWKAVVKETCIRPVVMLVSEPIVFLFAIYDGLNYAILYLAIEVGGLVFGQWGIGSPNVYLFPFSIVVGYLLAFPCYYAQTLIVKYMERRTGLKNIPEWRLIWGFFGCVLFPASMFLFAFTSSPQFHWVVPCIGLALFGTSSHILFIVVSDYVVDSYGHLAASAITGQSFLREIITGILTLVADPFYKNVGYKWSSGIIAFIALGLMVIPPLFYVYGPEIRKRSHWYAELKRIEELEKKHAELDIEDQERDRHPSA